MNTKLVNTAAELERLRARVAELEYVAPSPSCTRCYGADAVRFVAQGGATAPCPVCGPSEVERLRARVAELEAERHTTNEALDDAAKALREQRDRIAALEAAAVEGRAALAAFCHDLQDPGTAALGALFLLQQATIGAPMQPGETVPKVYRAQHDSIVMGLYITAAAARAHCEAEERRTWSKSTTVTFDWIEDDEDGVAELVTVTEDGETETVTGYIVTALEIASEYDQEADE
ncbi:hypothetical protein ACFWOX_33880 [Streptomyces sp. NPDC058467]|uniref:hypothetical protein n=1 Tax=Streptomyces sp. NPDC058467 TaxID=3346513 RepID=UPI003666F6FE